MSGLVSHASGIATVEWLEEVIRVRLAYGGFGGVVDGDDGLFLSVVDGAGDAAVSGVVGDGVADEVVDGKREVTRVCLDGCHPVGVTRGEFSQVSGQVLCGDLIGVHVDYVTYGFSQVNRFNAGIRCGLDVGEFKQTGDELATFAIRINGVPYGWFHVFGESVLCHERFETGADGGDWCFQFMAGVADERALQVVGLLDAVKHTVERRSKTCCFGVGVIESNAPCGVVGVELTGLLADGVKSCRQSAG